MAVILKVLSAWLDINRHRESLKYKLYNFLICWILVIFMIISNYFSSSLCWLSVNKFGLSGDLIKSSFIIFCITFTRSACYQRAVQALHKVLHFSHCAYYWLVPYIDHEKLKFWFIPFCRWWNHAINIFNIKLFCVVKICKQIIKSK